MNKASVGADGLAGTRGGLGGPRYDSSIAGAAQPHSALNSEYLWAAALAMLVVAYAPVLFFRYAFADDYAYLAIHGYRPINPYFMADGRPLGGFLAVGLFTAFDSVTADAWLRGLALTQLILALILIYRNAKRAGLDPAWSAFLPIFFAGSPAVQNWVIWGVSAWQMPALLLALGSVMFWRRLVDDQNRISVRNGVAFFALSFAAMLIYQPFAMAAWPLMFLECAIGVRPHTLRRMVLGGAVYGLMLICYFIVFKYYIITFVPPEGPHGRVGIIGFSALLAKLTWFVSVPLRTSFTPLSVHGVPALALLFAAAATVAVVYLNRFDWRRAALVLGLAFITVGVCHLPALAAPEATGIRTQVSLALAVDTLIVLAIVTFDRLIGVSAAVRTAIIFAACGVVSLWASYKILTIAVWPHSFEIALIEREFEKASFTPDQPIVLIGRPYGASLSGHSCDDVANMGCASLSMQFALPNMLRLWMRERGVDFKPYTILFVSSPSSTVAISFEASRTTSVPVPKNALFIDIGAAVLDGL